MAACVCGHDLDDHARDDNIDNPDPGEPCRKCACYTFRRVNPLTWTVDRFWLASRCTCGHKYDEHDPFRNGLPCLSCSRCPTFSMGTPC